MLVRIPMELKRLNVKQLKLFLKLPSPKLLHLLWHVKSRYETLTVKSQKQRRMTLSAAISKKGLLKGKFYGKSLFARKTFGIAILSSEIQIQTRRFMLQHQLIVYIILRMRIKLSAEKILNPVNNFFIFVWDHTWFSNDERYLHYFLLLINWFAFRPKTSIIVWLSRWFVIVICFQFFIDKIQINSPTI